MNLTWNARSEGEYKGYAVYSKTKRYLKVSLGFLIPVRICQNKPRVHQIGGIAGTEIVIAFKEIQSGNIDFFFFFCISVAHRIFRQNSLKHFG